MGEKHTRYGDEGRRGHWRKAKKAWRRQLERQMGCPYQLNKTNHPLLSPSAKNLSFPSLLQTFEMETWLVLHPLLPPYFWFMLLSDGQDMCSDDRVIYQIGLDQPCIYNTSRFQFFTSTNGPAITSPRIPPTHFIILPQKPTHSPYSHGTSPPLPTFPSFEPWRSCNAYQLNWRSSQSHEVSGNMFIYALKNIFLMIKKDSILFLSFRENNRIYRRNVWKKDCLNLLSYKIWE